MGNFRFCCVQKQPFGHKLFAKCINIYFESGLRRMATVRENFQTGFSEIIWIVINQMGHKRARTTFDSHTSKRSH